MVRNKQPSLHNRDVKSQREREGKKKRKRKQRKRLSSWKYKQRPWAQAQPAGVKEQHCRRRTLIVTTMRGLAGYPAACSFVAPALKSLVSPWTWSATGRLGGAGPFWLPPCAATNSQAVLGMLDLACTQCVYCLGHSQCKSQRAGNDGFVITEREHT